MGLSIMQRVAQLPPEARAEWLHELSDQALLEVARGEWWYVARPEQIPPPGDWLIALALAGRGWGKSRAGAEWLIEQVVHHPYDRHGQPTEWLLIGETLADTRTICLEGPAGILTALRRRKVDHRYKQSPRPMVLFPEGAKVYAEGADDEDVGRGYNASGAWLDEVCVAEGELVETVRGQVSIQDVASGEWVLTRQGYRLVVRSEMTSSSAHVVRITTEIGSVSVTKAHRVWVVGRGWTFARDVSPGDTMLTCRTSQSRATHPPSITKMVVLAVERVSDPTRVYDLEVEGASEFFAGGLLVHNCKWPKPYESWYEGILPSLRVDLIDDHPRAFITTTPKPIKILREWMGRTDGTVHLMGGSTFDNAANLSQHVLRELKNRYAGTTIGEQELYGKMLELAGGGLFKRMDIVRNRVQAAPDELIATVVGVDPNLTGEDAETGIVVVARDAKDEMFVLADASYPGTGRAAAIHMWRVVAQYGADILVYETNLGKRWMQEVLSDAYVELRDEERLFPANTTPPMKGVDSKHGKKTRAEPVAMRNEQGRLHIVGDLETLEDQMVLFDPESTRESPDRMDALVHACRYLMAGEKRRMRVADPSKYDFRLGQELYDLGRLLG